MMRKNLFLPLKRQHLFQTAMLLTTVALAVMAALWGKQQWLGADLPALLRHEAGAVKEWLFWQLWLPRALVAAGAGAALGAAGAVFQCLTRNPLGSPDIIGVNAGAAMGAVAAALLWPGYVPVTLGALLGSLLVLLLILLGTRGRMDFGMDIIISGLAVNAAALALVQFGLTSVRQESAQQMAAWLSGSLAARSWAQVEAVWLGLPPLLLALVLLNTRLGLLALGDAAAAALGVPLRRTAWLALLSATALAALAVVAAGPVAFLALAAPHLVRHLFDTDRPMIAAAALMGAVLLLLSDGVARLLPTASQLPVGVVTAGLGGVYLCILMIFSRKTA
ncbi:iron chelate uptake ABC transporter family permease subunit [Uruburuella testudinis]|uniref:Iron chelate uptake ABC transporter family permease subunit n=1 Tax=Uruburuella testudinis TaxID=1282863 RepID=A0ABY4DUE0_9NEIS|nr:iron chelate uptake ABC transporter family permease subunit [Uruburuella testudinis]UOO82290.1 iron chelate uptake ABC transporter family permease subunit [Uruburuella testudinis]